MITLLRKNRVLCPEKFDIEVICQSCQMNFDMGFLAMDRKATPEDDTTEIICAECGILEIDEYFTEE